MRRIFALLISFSALLAAQTAFTPDRSLFEHARADLDRASGYPYAPPADRERFDDARTRPFDFESRFERGRYEKHKLDEAIDRTTISAACAITANTATIIKHPNRKRRAQPE